MNVNLNLNALQMARKCRDLQAKGQILLKNEVAAGADKYVPFQVGNLRKSVKASINTPEPRLIYNSPYARYQYYGRVMVGRPPKLATDNPLTYHTSGTGPQWFEKWKAADGKATVQRVKAYAGQIYRR